MVVAGQNILITGATGFVGGALARALIQQGATVTALVRSTSDTTQLTGVRCVVGDVLEPSSLEGLFVGIDAVLHCAGMLGEAGVPESTYMRLHVDGTRHVLTAVQAQAPQAKILYVSSPGVLGPITGAPADETTSLAPSNAYERSKAQAENVALQFAERGLHVVIGRPEFIYGVGDLHVLGLFRAVQRGIFFYIGSGEYVCHPTYIEDAVHGLLLCLGQGKQGQIYHIMGPQPVSFRQFAETIADELGKIDAGGKRPFLTIPRPIAWAGATVLETVGGWLNITPPLSRTGVAFFSEDRRFSWQKAHEQLGYTPQYDLQQGIAKTVAWYKAQGHL